MPTPPAQSVPPADGPRREDGPQPEPVQRQPAQKPFEFKDWAMI